MPLLIPGAAPHRQPAWLSLWVTLLDSLDLCVSPHPLGSLGSATMKGSKEARNPSFLGPWKACVDESNCYVKWCMQGFLCTTFVLHPAFSVVSHFRSHKETSSTYRR